MRNYKAAIVVFILAMVSASSLLPLKAFAESCSGPTYTEPTCGGDDVNCDITACQDVSFSQDGTLFQCCPPSAAPEIPSKLIPLFTILGLAVVFFAWKRFSRKTAKKGS